MSMKGKLRAVWQVGLALVVASSLGLVMAAPAAADIYNVVVEPNPATTGSAAEYVITFYPNVGLSYPENVIIITFPDDTYVPPFIDKADVTVEDVGLETGKASAVQVTDRTVTIWLPIGVDIDYHHQGKVTLSVAAGLMNPTVSGTYSTCVRTDVEPNPVCDDYDIRPGPVTVYLKYQKPYEACGTIELHKVSTFPTIQEGLDFADALFMAMYSPTPAPYDPTPGAENDLGLYVECPEAGGYVGIRVEVWAGTYPETIVIDTPGLELVGVAGAATTIIDADGLCPWGPKNAVVFITTGGVTFQGFTVMNGGLNRYWYDCWGNDDDDDNIDTFGIAVRSDGSAKSQSPIVGTMATAAQARVNILDNIVHNNEASGIAIWGGCVLVNNNDVHHNDWDGFYGNELFVGVEICDPEAFTGGLHASNEIIYNQFYENGDDGISVRNAKEGPVDLRPVDGIPIDLYIVGNNIHDNTDAGIELGEGATGGVGSTVISIKFNQILDNAVGIDTAAMYPTFNIACVYNNIAGNTDWGIKNWDEDLLIAKMNWWNDLSGPSDGEAPVHPTVEDPDQTARPPALGTGDAVSHHVIYQWWLTDEFENVQLDLRRYYGSDRYQGMGNGPYDIPWAPIIPLKEGWNTLSVPVALDERADTLEEIQALGGWMQKMLAAYSYDPTSGWDLITTGYQLLPLNAIYVKISGPEVYDESMGESYADLFPILLRTSMWLPARDLEPGWNLVGLCGDFWNEEPANIITSELVDMVLSSVSGSWSNAISPSMPGQVESWVCTPATADQYDMFIGDGYWVFITKPTTLAGFSMAPWYLNEWEMDILSCLIPFMPF